MQIPAFELSAFENTVLLLMAHSCQSTDRLTCERRADSMWARVHTQKHTYTHGCVREMGNEHVSFQRIYKNKSTLFDPRAYRALYGYWWKLMRSDTPSECTSTAKVQPTNKLNKHSTQCTFAQFSCILRIKKYRNIYISSFRMVHHPLYSTFSLSHNVRRTFLSCVYRFCFGDILL